MKKSDIHTRKKSDKEDSGMNPEMDKKNLDVLSDKIISDLGKYNKYNVLSLEDNCIEDAEILEVNNVEIVDKEDFNKSLNVDSEVHSVRILGNVQIGFST
ncbi:hypothetical protein MA16_Dca023294 [Dendrobium catenatum]|uniref:Uncharacterized protein n=1 Tax=Dendrobium catenatum TaxID=906689 RepID=A0A2I0X647_9ASPA|nr:hypothetical protein MA16_Dca023294 [Dendrobium catenatum]